MAVGLVAVATLLIHPVGRDPELRRAVHLARADLNLVELNPRSKDGRVERLIAVRLRRGDVVLDPLLQRRPFVVNDAERVIAIGHAPHQHAERHEIIDLLERRVSLLHLPIDGPEMLSPAGHLELADPGALERLGQWRAQAFDHLLALITFGLHLNRQRVVVLRLEELEGEILQLRLDPRHAESVGERRVDFTRLESDAALAIGRQVLQRAHVMQAVRQLHDDDPRITRDGEKQFAVVLDLLLGGRAEGQRRNLRQPIHDVGHLAAELVTNLLE